MRSLVPVTWRPQRDRGTGLEAGTVTDVREPRAPAPSRRVRPARRQFVFALALALTQTTGLPAAAQDTVIVRPFVPPRGPASPAQMDWPASKDDANRLLGACASGAPVPDSLADLPPDRRRSAVTGLLDAAREASPPRPVDDIACAMVWVGPDGIAAAVEVLAQPREGLNVRPTAVAKLSVARLGRPAADALTRVLVDAGCDVRARIAADLLGAASPLPLERLTGLWLDHPNTCVAANAGLVLAYSREPRLLSDFVAQSASPAARVRVPAIVGLVTLDDPRGLRLAGAALRDADQSTHMLMATSLAPLLARADVRGLMARCARDWPGCSPFAPRELYLNSPDATGQRLGARYANVDVPAALSLFFVSSSAVVRLALLPFVALLVVAEFCRVHVWLTVVAVAVVAGESAADRLFGMRWRISLACAALAGLGWGALPVHSFGRHETTVLAGTAPAAFCYLLYRCSTALTGRQAGRWLCPVGMFYGGFALGLAWLWDDVSLRHWFDP